METAQASESQDRARPLSTLLNSSESRIVPYVGNVPDDEIRRLYEQLCEDGLAETIFVDGTIDSAETFLATVKSPRNLVVLIYFSGHLSGFAWLNAIAGHSAFAHFALLKSVWGAQAREFGRQVIEYWMGFSRADGSPLIELLLGTIPAWNRRAIRYVRDIGFVSVGVIPKLIRGRDGLCSAEIVYYERR